MSRVRARSATEWADACSSAFVPLRVRSASPRFAATLDRVELTPGVSVTRVASEGSEVVRTARTIAEHPRDDLLVSVHRSGRGSIAQHEREVALTNGRAALYDASAPYRLRFPGRMSEIVLQVPRGLVARTGHAFTDLTATALPASAGMTALQNLLWSIDPRTSQQTPLAEREMLADATTTLLRAALLPVDRPVPPAVDNQTLARSLRAYIDDHLTDPTLSVETVAIANHVS
ncbi:cupin domain-containing protein, partial [Gordonia soli]